MKIELPAGTPDNIAIAYNESVRIMKEVTAEANSCSKKYNTEVNIRKYIGYTLKFFSLIAVIFITAGYLSRELAIFIAILYAIDATLSNNKRVIAIAQAAKAYISMGKKVARTHETEQGKIFSSESDKVVAISKITSLIYKLVEEAHSGFTIIETAINQSDIETLQALSLKEDKLNLAMKYVQGHIRPK